ncbi:MAG: hypothetical protein IIB76_10965 [Proteobacteria bacterium]|nr:hypothetical protein [Pseudomonadota bacterium]
MRPISLLLLCLLALSGCRYGGPADPYAYENPYTDPEIKRVGVAPFLFSEKSLGEKYDFDLTGFETAGGRYVLYSEEIGRAFAQELAQFEGFEVTPPAEIVADCQMSIREGNDRGQQCHGQHDANYRFHLPPCGLAYYFDASMASLVAIILA